MSTTAATPSPSIDWLLASFDNTLGQSRRLRRPRAVIWTGAVCVAAAATWAVFAPVDQVVHTQGRIVPSARQQLVQHLEGGIVSKVYVREGDVVTVGDPLVAVSDLAANSSRGETAARMSGLRARVARLEAEAAGSPRFTPPPELSLADPAVRAEAEAFGARTAKLVQTTRVLEEQASQRRQEAAEAEARAKGLRAELDVARAQLALVQQMVSRNAGSQTELLDARSKVERMTTQIAETEASRPRLAAAAAELLARIAETSAQFRSEARTALSDSRVGVPLTQTACRSDWELPRRNCTSTDSGPACDTLTVHPSRGVAKSRSIREPEQLTPTCPPEIDHVRATSPLLRDVGDPDEAPVADCVGTDACAACVAACALACAAA